MNSYERGRASLRELIAKLQLAPHIEAQNEAMTRYHVIDTVLEQVLAWPKLEISVEDYADGEFRDYVLGNPERSLVVEAKKFGHHFDKPAGVSTGKIKIKTFQEYSTNNHKAVEQLLKYCQSSGIAVGLLTNGHQFLGFLASRSDGKKPIDGDAMYFENLNSVVDSFNSFWDSFSKDGILAKNIHRKLGNDRNLIPPPLPLSSRISSYPGYRIGTAMETDLRILGDLFIQDVIREEAVTDDFLMNCYCSSGALSQYASVSKEILRTRYALLEDGEKIESATGKEGANPKFAQDLLGSALTRRPIVLLGDVGVGKSIFLKHFFRIDARELLEKTYVFYIDFLQHSGLGDDVSNHVVKIIKECLEQDYGIDIHEDRFVKSVYNKEINAFKRGIFGSLEQEDPAKFRGEEIAMLQQLINDHLEHTKRSLSFLHSTSQINMVVILDNVDQHDASFQDRIFIFGQSIAETWNTAVFMSLRPDTFNESRRNGVLAAYQPRVFTISPPRCDEVIIKRLEFAQKELVEFGRLPGFPEGLTLNSDSLKIYISVLIRAFQSNHDLIELVDNLSSGNTRRALNFISTFVGSGYVQTSRILDVERAGESYVVPLHEFLKAVLFGDHKYYDPHTSLIPNLYSTKSTDPKEHFLLSLLLSFIQTLGDGKSGGFTERAEVFSHLQELGFSPEQINEHFHRAEVANMIDSSDAAEGANLVRITSAGGYLYKVLSSEFSYIDAVVVDTPILDPSARSNIQDVNEIADRIKRTEIFMAYLDSCWPFGESPLPFSWPLVLKEWKSSLATVKRGAERAASRRDGQ